MKKLIILLFVMPFISFSQDKGVSFEHGLNWEQVKTKAKTENKFIFVDCFTTWCQPCKYMTSTIFPQAKVGEFFNTNFVNLKVQMDQTDQDSPEIKSWYKEAARFASEYSVVAYPTFLIFNPQGELVHRIVGGGEAEDFIVRAKEGLNPKTQYVTLVKKYRANPNDAVIAKDMATAASHAYDRELEQEATNRYVELVGGETLLTPENIGLLLRGATSSKSPSFVIIKNNKAKVDTLLLAKNRTANDVLSSVLSSELVMPKIRNKEENIDFPTLQLQIEKDHPYVNMSASMARAKAQYYQGQKNWPAFKDAVEEYIAASETEVFSGMLNSYAWSIFENCDDAACLQAALAWSKKSIAEREEPVFVDTYANLLYKSGDKQNALIWQQKAVDNSTGRNQEAFRANLLKMQNGQPTW